MKRAPIVTAGLCTAGVLLWQFLIVHSKRGDDWTAIYYTGAYTQTPPAIDNEQIYRFPDAGFDGQFYHFIAHDPWMRLGSAPFVDNPRLRWRRILVPALAWMFALGQSDFVDSAYVGVMLAFVFAGTYWLSRFLVRCGFAAGWGAAFVFVPAVLIGMDRGTVDAALAALCMGFALYAAEEESWQIYLVLALAPLARETGVCLIAAFVAVQLGKRSWKAAGIGVLTLLPFAAWLVFVNAHSAPDQTKFASYLPLQGLVQRTLHPLQYPVTSTWLKKAAALDYVAVLGIWLALLFVAMMCGRRFRLPTDPLQAAAVTFSAVAIFFSHAQAWPEAYAFARTMSPLLIFVALLALRDRIWWGLIPIFATLPRILFQLLTVLKSA